MTKRFRSRRIFFVALCLLVMLVIFGFSAQDGTKSKQISDLTCAVLQNTGLDSTFTPLTLAGAAYANVRKWAHVYLYALLGLLLPQALAYWPLRLRTVLWLSALVAFLYSCSDEFHQLFVPGRAALLSDLRVDAMGYLPGIAISFAILLLWRHFCQKRPKGERGEADEK